MTDVSLLVTNELIPEVIDEMRKQYRVSEKYGCNGQELADLIGDYDVLICRSATKVTAEVLASAKRLKLIISATSGLDHIDIQEANRLGIPVCHTLYGNTNANAEHNIGVLIALSRHFIASHKNMCEGGWGHSQLLGNEISGKTLGIIGFGRIGQKTAEYARAFGMNVIVYDNYHLSHESVAQFRAEAVGMNELMERSDFVVLSVPRTSETIDLVTKRDLRLMKPTAYMVQVSRGGVVNEDDLIEALQQEKIAGAAIDVFVGEPSIDRRFRTLSNVMLSPHVACSTRQSRYNSGMATLDEVNRFLAGEALLYQARSSVYLPHGSL